LAALDVAVIDFEQIWGYFFPELDEGIFLHSPEYLDYKDN